MPERGTLREPGTITSKDKKKIKEDIEKGKEEYQKKKNQQVNPDLNENPFPANNDKKW